MSLARLPIPPLAQYSRPVKAAIKGVLYYNESKKASIKRDVLVNPLFDQPNDETSDPKKQDDGYVFKHRKARTIQPLDKDLKLSMRPAATHTGQPGKVVSNPAIELIRRKVDALYAEEPDVKEELVEAAQPAAPLSKHQQFMRNLSTSGKSLAEIQTAWHNYYAGLPDDEKHAVWREFYQANNRTNTPYSQFAAQHQTHAVSHAVQHTTPSHTSMVSPHTAVQPHAQQPLYQQLPAANLKTRREHRTRSRIKQQLIDKVGISAEAQAKAKQHFQSLLFGIGTGLVVLVVFLFSFFNEVIIAPFIQPSRHVSATPLIVSSDNVAASDTPEVIIPKINVQIPTVFDEPSTDEAAIESALERGVVHYPNTVLPGQRGNAAFFGHSSNNIFNKGQYKFAFVLLHELVPGDIFYLTYNKVTYTYRVYDKKVVAPSEVSVLNNVPDKVATATLITCDPPGTSNNRLIVWGEQISPDPASAAAPSTTTDAAATTPTQLSGNGPTLWSKFWNWLF